MSAPASPATTQLETLRGLVTTATQRLLGDTISVAEEQWRAPSRLPGWTRGHVATHIARHADALVRLAQWARTGERRDMYPSPEHRGNDIEAGSPRSGLELQIDLDTSAGRLSAAFDELDGADAWDSMVEMTGGMKMPARLLPLARLLEVVIHHVDLDIGYEITDIDTQTAEWLLEWSTFRLRDRDGFPRLHLTSDTGFTTTVGSAGEPIAVGGGSTQLLGWLLGRTDASALTGADGLQLPGY
ncbi:MAG TPA: maleylpyruvate isomerase family mycothiol-dependent enzyme [Propionibacteriaceae bacterium]|nr:maleylpyruvate isomerase family mycothiol-dependent enzyme [Propionibacteriaceae bacterium]